ncbi:MAG: DoxX family protein [Chitinophagia bacterium]|nr:DoxX family protein [Chitinophagia bacterium]
MKPFTFWGNSLPAIPLFCGALPQEGVRPMPRPKPTPTVEVPQRTELRSSREMRRSKRKKARKWSIAIWGVQAVVSAIFLMQGIMKLVIPNDQLAFTMPWVSLAPTWLVSLIGFAEIVVASLLIGPALLRYRPELCIRAGLVLLFFMIIAVTYHVMKREYGAIPYNILVMLLTGFIIWGRLRKDPIRPRDPSPQPPPLNRSGFF